MIFYAVHGGEEACGANCTDWIAAEGAIQWDTFKRLFTFLDRFGQNKRPIVLDFWGEADFKTAMSLGKIIRDRRLDVRVGTTLVAKCANATEADCFALKRSGQQLDARLDTSAVECDFACVIVLAGRAPLAAGRQVMIAPIEIKSHLAPNVSQDFKQELGIYYNEQIELYLAQMGISPEIIGTIDRNAKTHQATRLSNEQCLRLGIVTGLAL